MTNGLIAARAHGPIRHVLFDLRGTLLRPFGKETSERLFIRVAEEVLERPLAIEPAEFAKRVLELRLKLAKSSTPLSLQGGPDFRAGINAAILNGFREKCGIDQGREISRRYVRRTRRWGISFEWMKLLARLSSDLPLYIASNASADSVREILDQRRALPYFREIFTPEVLGGTGKSPEFYRMIAERLGAPPWRLAMVGNSLFYDLAAAKAGIPTIWFVPRNRRFRPMAEELWGRDIWEMVHPCGTVNCVARAIAGLRAR